MRLKPNAVRNLLLLLALVLLAHCGGGPGLASSRFDNTDEGWTLGGDVGPLPQLKAEGGNPTGHICGKDSVEGAVWTFVAPPKFLGDKSRAYGQRLTFDLKLVTRGDVVQGRDVNLQGAGLSLVTDLRTPPGLDWQPFSLQLDETQPWKRDAPGFPTASAEELQSVLRNLNAIRIRGEYLDGPDEACLDNVVFGQP